MSTTNTPALRAFRNTDPRFGDVGPFEAVSAEALADEVLPNFPTWDRAEFLAALEEVRRYTIVSGEGTGEGAIETATLTESELIDRLERERCGGDRWAFARDEDGDRLEF